MAFCASSAQIYDLSIFWLPRPWISLHLSQNRGAEPAWFRASFPSQKHTERMDGFLLSPTIFSPPRMFCGLCWIYKSTQLQSMSVHLCSVVFEDFTYPDILELISLSLKGLLLVPWLFFLVFKIIKATDNVGRSSLSGLQFHRLFSGNIFTPDFKRDDGSAMFALVEASKNYRLPVYGCSLFFSKRFCE